MKTAMNVPASWNPQLTTAITADACSETHLRPVDLSTASRTMPKLPAPSTPVMSYLRRAQQSVEQICHTPGMLRLTLSLRLQAGCG